MGAGEISVFFLANTAFLDAHQAVKKCEMMTHLGAPPGPSPCPNLPAGWRNVYWAELKKKLVVSIIVCKHRFLKASSVLSSPAPHMLYIQSILEKSLGEHYVYYSRATQQMGGWSALRVDSQQSGGPSWCLLSQSIKRENKVQSLERKVLAGACSNPWPPFIKNTAL